MKGGKMASDNCVIAANYSNAAGKKSRSNALQYCTRKFMTCHIYRFRLSFKKLINLPVFCTHLIAIDLTLFFAAC